MKIDTRLDYDKVLLSKDNKVHMMVELVAPEADENKRNPLIICAVIDRSGSMTGEKLDQVKQSMYKLIDHLTENDHLGLVFFNSFSSSVKFMKMGSAAKDKMKREIAAIQADGCTDIGRALNEASEMYSNFEGSVSSVERVILLTDGQPTTGISAPEQFIPVIRKIRKGVGLSCIGYGKDYNENLLTEIAKEGKGGNYFVDTPDNVSKVFAVELGGLLSCFAQDAVVSVKMHKGAKIVNVLNDLDVSTTQDDDGDLVTNISVGDVFGGENKSVVIKIDCEKRSQALPRSVTIADITVKYRALSDNETKSDVCKIKVSFIKDSDDVPATADKKVAEQVAILEAATMQKQAKTLADSGDWAGAKRLCNDAVCFLSSIGTETTTAYAASIGEMSEGLNAGYTAGGVLSKAFGSASFAYSTGNSYGLVGSSLTSAHAVPGAMNSVRMKTMESFSGTLGDDDNQDGKISKKKSVV